MRGSEKILGPIFVGLTVFNLLRGDWLGAALMGLAAAATLLGRRLQLPLWAELALAAVMLILFALKFARAFGWASL